ncbi:MAG: glycosyltransferase family 2 protein [Candidatus Zixiibacteriota bacterium]|nr:MAG: glycosyltransferase family 2 protein [candidate division Zixibacteria bacterium]
MDKNLNRQANLVLVPAYNAGKYLPELIDRLRTLVADDNLLFVNDGSTDNTLELLEQHQVKYISFPLNQGKGAALMAGFQYAIENEYRSVLTIDADLQHLPEEIPRFYALDDGRHLILGTRKINLKIMPFDRWLTNNLTSMIISIFSTQRVRDSQSGFRLIPTSVLAAIRLKTVNYDFESEMLFKAGALGCAIAEVPISTIYEGSTSYINPLRDTGRFIRQIWKRIWA